MTESITTEPQHVTLPKDVLENLIHAAYTRGFNNARHWPHRPCPMLTITWIGENQAPVFSPKWNVQQ